jgi:hypothetical protein
MLTLPVNLRPAVPRPRNAPGAVLASGGSSACLTVSLVCPQVRTLFVSGLPMDAKPRELYLLFRAYEVSTHPW